jgi:hypothetical protein
MPNSLVVIAGVVLFIALSGGDGASDPAPRGSCLIPGSKIGMEFPGCDMVASDTASSPAPLPFWGRMDCVDPSRHRWVASGGDGHPIATGSKQANSAFRRLAVIDGDDIWGERCELGYNWNAESDPGTGIRGPGPTVFYHEGSRRVTYVSLRLPHAWDVHDPDWRVVLQMKQTEPYDNHHGGPMLDLQVRGGSWVVMSEWEELWTAPARTGAWTRFAFDVTYSADPARGSIRVHVDLNGDGDFGDSGERSPTFNRATLRREAPNSVTQPGESIPSHLRAGLYQNENYACPAPAGCHVDLDNVQVLGP